jgi:ABC-2 type transport system permease protein
MTHALRAFSALFRKELAIYFGSPLVYLVAAAFLAYTGYYFHSDLVYFLTFGFGINIMENFWQLVFMDVRLVLIFAIPLLTMRLLAEERRLGTLELLVTYPVSDRAIVAAKLGACLVVVVLLIAATGLYPWWIYRVQPFDVKPLLAGYLGLVLLATACASYGLFVSACTESQVLAGFLTAMPLLLLWLLSWNEAASAVETLAIVRALSLFNHFQPFAVGIVEARDVFYFVMLAAGFVWATLRVLEVRQWRGRR